MDQSGILEPHMMGRSPAYLTEDPEELRSRHSSASTVILPVTQDSSQITEEPETSAKESTGGSPESRKLGSVAAVLKEQK